MGYQKIKIIAPLVALTFVVGLFGLYFSLQKPMSIKTIQVGDTSVTVEIADTLVTQTQGLSGRDTLYSDQGMLFVYPEKALRNFWMKDMLIPLDALWIADGMVIGIEENIPYRLIEGEIPRFKSLKPADMVLEVFAGWVAENGVKVGDIVDVKS